MTVFAILNVANPLAMQNALNEKFPDNHLQVNATAYLVAAVGLTAKDVSDKLGVTESDSTGSAIIFTTSGYYGRAPTNVWEWIAAKIAQP